MRVDCRRESLSVKVRGEDARSDRGEAVNKCMGAYCPTSPRDVFLKSSFRAGGS